MAQVQIEEIVDHLRSEFRRALEAAVDEVSPNGQVDSYELYRAFRRAIRRKCNTWETVPGSYIRP